MASIVLFRRLLGQVLRSRRVDQGKTLRELSADAQVSLGYISEIERGQKEASSELLAALCAALDAPLSQVLADVSDAVALEEAALALQIEKIEKLEQLQRIEVSKPLPSRGPDADRHGDIPSTELRAKVGSAA
jgi:transcriptional regulator with XRE-family HTH domain